MPLLGKVDAVVLDVQCPLVVLDVVAPLLEPFRLQLLAERLFQQPRGRVTTALVPQLPKVARHEGLQGICLAKVCNG